MTSQEIVGALQWRYATKKFDPAKKISDSDWKTLEQSLHLSPSSYGLQTWKFFVVHNSSLRAQLRDASYNQSQVTDCSHFVALAYNQKVDEAYISKYISRIADVRGIPPQSLDAFKSTMVGHLTKGLTPAEVELWAQRQVYIAMGFLLETAALLKIDACPMEGIVPSAYDKILGLEGSGFKTLAAVAVGYRHPEDPIVGMKKVRFPVEHVVEHKR